MDAKMILKHPLEAGETHFADVAIRKDGDALVVSFGNGGEAEVEVLLDRKRVKELLNWRMVMSL